MPRPSCKESGAPTIRECKIPASAFILFQLLAKTWTSMRECIVLLACPTDGNFEGRVDRSSSGRSTPKTEGRVRRIRLDGKVLSDRSLANREKPQMSGQAVNGSFLEFDPGNNDNRTADAIVGCSTKTRSDRREHRSCCLVASIPVSNPVHNHCMLCNYSGRSGCRRVLKVFVFNCDLHC